MHGVAGRQGTRVEVPQGETAHLSGGGPHDDGVEAQAVVLLGERRGDGDNRQTGPKSNGHCIVINTKI